MRLPSSTRSLVLPPPTPSPLPGHFTLHPQSTTAASLLEPSSTSTPISTMVTHHLIVIDHRDNHRCHTSMPSHRATINKIEGELAKVKKSNLEAKYPTSFEFLDHSSKVQLRDFACELGMKLNQVMPLLKHNPITTMTHFDYNNNDNTSIMSNSHVESSGSSISNVDNGFYPIMLMGQNVFGIDQRLMQALNPNSMKSGVINDCYDRPNFDLKREMMHQLEQPQYRNMHQFMPSCFY
ncbi:hypothetical protein Tco_0592683 [Tanacetum coccineum]